MTCVVYDGQQLITDSQVTLADMAIPTPMQKIFTPRDDEYWEINGVRVIAFGFAGSLAGIPYVNELLNAGITHRTVLTPETDTHIDAICVLETGDSYILSSCTNRQGKQDTVCLPMNPPVSVGSGSPYAYALLEKGKPCAVKAVKAAIKLDVNCGGDLQVWDLPPVPEVLSKRPVAAEPTATDGVKRLSDMTLDELTTLIKDQITTHVQPAVPVQPEPEKDKMPVLH